MENSGYLVVRVSSGGGAYPIEGAVVIVESADEYDRLQPRSYLTDRDGNTEEIILPAPNVSYSLAPNQSELPFYNYRVFVKKNGYYGAIFDSVPIFPGIHTSLPVILVPDSHYNADRNVPNTVTRPFMFDQNLEGGEADA